MAKIPDMSQIFGADGPLARAVAGYRERAQQVEMAQCVAAALADNRALVAEAGTGTGKTFAYLVPALLAHAKVIISTGTKTLQDQLFQRDLPAVRDALKVPASLALLKGRPNYVCHYHLERALADGQFGSRAEAHHIRIISRFAGATGSGDKAECAAVPEDSPAWRAATSTRDNCLGQDCPCHRQCFVMAARRAAMAADVVVVNHHLFFADVALRDEGLAELLPACNAVIFDEAHQLPETASLFFGESVSTAQLRELARDTQIEARTAAKDFAALPEAAQALEKAARELRLALPEDNTRLSLQQAQARAAFLPAAAELTQRLQETTALLEAQAERSEGLAGCWRRASELAGRIGRWHTPQAPDFVRWVEVYSQSAALQTTPLAVADIFRKQLTGHPQAWVFTSATLAVGSDFSHFCNQLGLEDAQCVRWGSPFDYPNQALLCVPEGMPDPNSSGYSDAVIDAAYPALRASGGRAFVLCTSLRAMQRIHAGLRERFARDRFEVPLLLQGEGARSELLTRFRRLGNAVLVGSQSFWEGVDVRGDALSLVIIDRLPFAPPDDPVLAARIDHLERSGRNAFMEYQLPRAVINIKQGAGRLIRDEGDRGVLMICDPRVVTRPYGRIVWRSLPPMRRTRSREEVLAFLARDCAEAV